MEGMGGAPSAPPGSVYEAKKAVLMTNLDKANIVRKAKKALREGIKSGEIEDLPILRGDSKYEDFVREWPVERLLLIMKRIGKSRATDILDFARVRPHTKLRALSFAKRQELCDLVIEARTPGGGPL